MNMTAERTVRELALEDACRASNLSVDQVIDSLEMAEEAAHATQKDRNWQIEPLADLITHIKNTHHKFTREEMARELRVLWSTNGPHQHQMLASYDSVLTAISESVMRIPRGTAAGSVDLPEILPNARSAPTIFRRVLAFKSRGLGSQSEMAIRIGQKGHHFLERGNVEGANRTNEFQPVAHRFPRIEQLKLNLMIVSPSLKKYQHAETAGFECAHLRKIEHDNPRVFERRHRAAELESRFAPHDPSYAFDNPEFSDSFNP